MSSPTSAAISSITLSTAQTFNVAPSPRNADVRMGISNNLVVAT
jgi:hypothetical protein